MSWDLLVVHKPADARSRSDKSTEQVLAETTRSCLRCFVPICQAGGVRAHDVRQSSLSARILLVLPLHDCTSATHDASFCTGRAEASHSEVLASVERQIRSNWAQLAHDNPAGGGHSCALPRDTHHTSRKRLKLQMCPCVGDAAYGSTTTARRGFVPLRRLCSLM